MKQELQVATMAQPNQIEKVTEQTLLSHLDNLGLLKDLTKGEKDTYLQICKAYNLNPFKREIHVSKYKDKMSIITGYETYIKRAERTGLLDGWDVATQGSVKEGNLKAIITIYRKDRSRPFTWEALYSEYVQTTDEYVNGKPSGNKRPTSFWLKAETMTKKVAMSQGFRLCFSDELGGMPYTAEEMPEITQDVPHVEVIVKPEVVKADKAELAAAIKQIKAAVTVDELKEIKAALPAYIVSDASFKEAGKEQYNLLIAEPVTA